MSAPSRFVIEAMKRRLAVGLCPICGAALKKPSRLLLKKAQDEQPKPVCPNANDGKHGQRILTMKRAKKMGLLVKPKERKTTHDGA